MNASQLDTSVDRFLRAGPGRQAILERLGIDVVQEKSRSLREVFQAHGLDAATAARFLDAFEDAAAGRARGLELMTLTELCHHIEQLQHPQLRHALETLDQLTRTAAETNPNGAPRISKLRAAFVQFRGRMEGHLRAEREILFPLIREMERQAGRGAGLGLQLKHPTARMEMEHNEADEALAELRALAGSDVSAGAAGLEAGVLSALAEVERNVQEQIYVENQLLFPRALAIGRG